LSGSLGDAHTFLIEPPLTKEVAFPYL
jgi:hypothetical protein